MGLLDKIKKGFEKTITKPLVKEIIKPTYTNVILPSIKTVNQEVIKPASKVDIIKEINREVIQPTLKESSSVIKTIDSAGKTAVKFVDNTGKTVIKDIEKTGSKIVGEVVSGFDEFGNKISSFVKGPGHGGSDPSEDNSIVFYSDINYGGTPSYYNDGFYADPTIKNMRSMKILVTKKVYFYTSTDNSKILFDLDGSDNTNYPNLDLNLISQVNSFKVLNIIDDTGTSGPDIPYVEPVIPMDPVDYSTDVKFDSASILAALDPPATQSIEHYTDKDGTKIIPYLDTDIYNPPSLKEKYVTNNISRNICYLLLFLIGLLVMWDFREDRKNRWQQVVLYCILVFVMIFYFSVYKTYLFR